MKSSMLKIIIRNISFFACIGLSDFIYTEQRVETQHEKHVTQQDIRPALKYIISLLISEAEVNNATAQLPSELFSLHDALQKNAPIPSAQFMRVLPLIMHCTIKQLKESQKLRAPRPDAPSPKDSDALVGPDSSINLAPLLTCCKKALKRIGSVCDSSCCDTVLGILGDACTILGPDKTISDKLLELCNLISNLTTTIEVTLDFNEVFTALEGLEETLCDKFEGVFTVLDTIIIEEEEGFNGIFTTLDRICEKIINLTASAMISVDFNEIFTALEGVEETLCNKFEGAFTVLEDILDREEEGFNATFTILDTICDKVEGLTDTILAVLDFNGIFTALSGVEETLCDKFEGVFTILEEQGLCLPTPLTQDDVVNGDILLNIDGINYCMAENITATIVITGNNVNLDMNDRVLFGVININADDVIVENGKVQPFGPLTNDTNDPAITIGSENTVLRDLFVICENTPAFQVAGRIGIMNGGNKTRILNCSIKSGGAGGDVGLVVAQSGGDGIINTGDDLLIINCIIETGFGGIQLSDGLGGNGGNAIRNIMGTPVIIQDTLILTGSGGLGTVGADQGLGGSGGIGILGEAGSLCITNCKIFTGAGAEGETSAFPNNNGTGGVGMFFTDLVNTVIVDECVIETGPGRDSGSGITYFGDSLFKVAHTSIITGVPFINGGYGLLSTSSCTTFFDITIKTLNALASPGTQSGPFVSTGTGIIVLGSASIEKAIIITGNGVDIAGSGDGGKSGPGIFAANVGPLAIKHCTIATGNGGSSADATGGDAGHAIHLLNATDVLVENCVLHTGIGGVGVESNGAGGSTLFSENSDNVTIWDTISNQAGANGFEIDNSRTICINHSKAINSALNGFDIIGTTSVFVICNSTAIGSDGIGFFLDTGVFDGQVISNQAENNTGGGIINASGDIARHQIWNNVANNNGGAGNFSGVALVIAAPTVNTGFYSNVIL